jgi:hypothetical protein
MKTRLALPLAVLLAGVTLSLALWHRRPPVPPPERDTSIVDELRDARPAPLDLNPSARPSPERDSPTIRDGRSDTQIDATHEDTEVIRP